MSVQGETAVSKVDYVLSPNVLLVNRLKTVKPFFSQKKYLNKKKKAQIKDVSVDIDSLTALAPLNRCLKHDSPKQKPCPATG